MKSSNRSSVVLSLIAGSALTVFAGAMMGQGAARPAPADTQYFVTADDGEAHLWLREGSTIRMVAHGTCDQCAGIGDDGHGDDDGHAHDDRDGHDHATPAVRKSGVDHDDHGHGEGGSIGTATIGAWNVAVSGEIRAGAEAHLDIKLSGSTARPTAVRVWIGSQDGRGAMKQKADGGDNAYHAHADVPSPIPAEAKLWIEIDDGKGSKAVGGFAIPR